MGTVHFSVSLAKPVKMFKEFLLVLALAAAAAHGSPFKKGFPIKFKPIFGKREAEPIYGYRSQVYDYNNYDYNLGHNNYGYNYGYQQHLIHKRSPFKKGFPIKFKHIFGKREAEPGYGYRSQVYGYNSYGYNLGQNNYRYNYGYQQHSIHKRSPALKFSLGLRF